MKRRRTKLQNRILELLASGPIRTQREIAERVGSSQPSVSRALKKLREEDLIGLDENGQYCHLGNRNLSEIGGAVARALTEHMSTLSLAYQRADVLRRGIGQAVGLEGILRYSNHITPLVAAARAMTEHLDKLIPPHVQYFVHELQQAGFLQNTIAGMISALDQVQPHLLKYHSFINRYVRQAERIHQMLSELPPIYWEANRKLLEYGWFITPRMTIPGVRRIWELLEQDKVQDAIKGIKAFYEEGMEAALEEAYSHPSFAERRDILDQALSAHKNGHYALSVPVFLAQAEGIAKKDFGLDYLYTKNKRRIRDATEKTGGQFERVVIDSFIEYIFSRLAQNCSDAKRLTPDVLSRHAVLHGVDIRYHTYDNSLRSYMFLDTLYYLVSREDEESKTN